MLTRIIDFLKIQNITAMFTNLTVKGMIEETSIGISSLMDTWILLRETDITQRDTSGNAVERQRAIHILKSRGMAHSRKIEPFEITDDGIHMLQLGRPSLSRKKSGSKGLAAGKAI
jgi:circadian clock protein KaiC